MKIKSLLLCHLLMAVLLCSFFCSYTRVYWNYIDHAFFHFLNDPMENNTLLQHFWAFSNHKMADWVEDGIYGLLFITYILSPSAKSRTRKAAEFAFCVLLIGIILYSVNRIIFREQLTIYRDSPTMVIEHCVRLSKEIPWLKIKDFSPKCFPADHATTAILLAFTFSYIARGKPRVIACLYSVFLCLPRMATGAHWLSDMIVGSGSIVLFFLSWTYCTPLQTKTVAILERFFTRFHKKSLNINLK